MKKRGNYAKPGQNALINDNFLQNIKIKAPEGAFILLALVNEILNEIDDARQAERIDNLFKDVNGADKVRYD